MKPAAGPRSGKGCSRSLARGAHSLLDAAGAPASVLLPAQETMLSALTPTAVCNRRHMQLALGAEGCVDARPNTRAASPDARWIVGQRRRRVHHWRQRVFSAYASSRSRPRFARRAWWREYSLNGGTANPRATRLWTRIPYESARGTKRVSHRLQCPRNSLFSAGATGGIRVVGERAPQSSTPG